MKSYLQNWNGQSNLLYKKFIIGIKDYTIKMTDRKASYSLRQNPSDDSDYKYNLDSSDPKIRVLQYDLVFVNGISSSIASKEILMKDIYFGRYGRVIKSTLNPPYPFKKGVTYQMYATYQTQLNASLAIVALDGLNLGDRPLKVSYGTTKYCSYFLKGRECINNDCFYLHKIQKERQVLNGDTKTIFREQNDRAIDVVLNNLERIVERILDSKIENITEGFPSLTETIDFLIDNEYLTQHQYDAVVKDVKKAREAAKNKQNYTKIPQQDVKSSQKQKEEHLLIDDAPKLVKSNSFSTMASPNKPEAASTEFDEQDKRVSQIDHKEKPKTSEGIFNDQESQNRTVKSEDQNKKSYQISLDFDQKIEDNISQKIIKEIMKKKNVKSKFDFVKIDVRKIEVAEEMKKVKNIIQRFLITYQ